MRLHNEEVVLYSPHTSEDKESRTHGVGYVSDTPLASHDMRRVKMAEERITVVEGAEAMGQWGHGRLDGCAHLNLRGWCRYILLLRYFC